MKEPKDPAKEIKTVTAPVLVVEDSTPAPTVLDTQKIRKLLLEAARLVSAEELAKSKPKADPDTPKSPPYLLVIVLMVLSGFGAIILLATIRPDLDFVIVAGVILPTVTVMTSAIFNAMQRGQTLLEAREARINSQLALVQGREMHDLINSRLTEFKEDFIAAEKERSKNAAAQAFQDGRKEGGDAADARTDKLAAATPPDPKNTG